MSRQPSVAEAVATLTLTLGHGRRLETLVKAGIWAGAEAGAEAEAEAE